MVGGFISIKDKFTDLIRRGNSIQKYLKENEIEHYLFTCDLVEYNFKDIYKTFNISYFSKDNNLINNFVASDDLKDYEVIENNSNQVKSILIKKFKLRLKFIKNYMLSDEIIFSDCYDFNPNFLSHKDFIVKIAIVKKDCEKWLKSSNLNDYDYIFASNEFYNELNENYNVFLIEKDLKIYEQIKYVLNILYKRKADKFFSFIKQVDFQKVFPKWKHYFKVLNSEYFDDQWYRKTYHLENNTDSAVHYLLIGYEKGYNPGPDFSTFEYYECNKDVEIKGMNPLVHYELYGRKEFRAIRTSDIPKRDYFCILNSHYFDEEWYKSTYDLNDVDDYVDHYLNVGYTLGFNPGPDFSTYEYYECNRDVKEVAMNPLIHYVLHGKNERRTICFSEDVRQKHYALISDSPYFDGDWYGRTYSIEGDCVDHYLNVGYALGFNPGPDFSTYEYYKCNEDVKDYGMNPLLHYELYGKYENRMLWISDMQKRDYMCISNSNYFDKKWYEETYSIKGTDPVIHYLNVGYTLGFNPGPDFSTYEYWECNKEIKEWKMNPLLHYELYGRKEERIICFSEDVRQKHYSLISDSPYFDKKWYEETYSIKGTDPVIHYLNVGYALGFNPSINFGTNEYYECNPDVEEYGMNPLLHYEMFGKEENRQLHVSDMKDSN